jgi:predicted Fe-Mo cluster-binding NifX family protein
MKIAIPASADNPDALIDERFGRCAFFCFYNTKTQKFDFIENNLKNDKEGVGPKVVEYLANYRVNEVYAYHVGPKAQNIMHKLNIKLKIVNTKQTVKQAIDLSN